jgi:hypothetical protein
MATLLYTTMEQPVEQPSSTRYVQVTRFYEAISGCSIWTGQGNRTKTYKVPTAAVGKEELIQFLRTKLAALETTTTNPYEYLNLHSINTPEETTQEFRRVLRRRHHKCREHSQQYAEVELADNTIPPTKGDKKKGYPRGLTSIRASILAGLLSGDITYDKLVERAKAFINSPEYVTVHLCKNSNCISAKHTTQSTHIVNQRQHENCGSYWVIDSILVNFCTCNAESPCIVPGPLFDAARFKAIMVAFMEALKDNAVQIDPMDMELPIVNKSST